MVGVVGGVVGVPFGFVAGPTPAGLPSGLVAGPVVFGGTVLGGNEPGAIEGAPPAGLVPGLAAVGRIRGRVAASRIATVRVGVRIRARDSPAPSIGVVARGTEWSTRGGRRTRSRRRRTRTAGSCTTAGGRRSSPQTSRQAEASGASEKESHVRSPNSWVGDDRHYARKLLQRACRSLAAFAEIVSSHSLAERSFPAVKRPADSGPSHPDSRPTADGGPSRNIGHTRNRRARA